MYISDKAVMQDEINCVVIFGAIFLFNISHDLLFISQVINYCYNNKVYCCSYDQKSADLLLDIFFRSYSLIFSSSVFIN